jgi:uncharacterized membrane protein
MNNNQMTILATGSALNGAGLSLVREDLVTGLILIGVGTLLTVLVAVLNKYNIPVSSNLG